MAKYEMKVVRNNGMADSAGADLALVGSARLLLSAVSAYAAALEGGLRLSSP